MIKYNITQSNIVKLESSIKRDNLFFSTLSLSFVTCMFVIPFSNGFRVYLALFYLVVIIYQSLWFRAKKEFKENVTKNSTILILNDKNFLDNSTIIGARKINWIDVHNIAMHENILISLKSSAYSSLKLNWSKRLIMKLTKKITGYDIHLNNLSDSSNEKVYKNMMFLLKEMI